MMKVFSVAVFIAFLPLLGWAAAQEFPKDVLTFLDERESCDHWRGEDGYDKERQADINWSICQSCPGTDAQLAKLKKKYRTNKAIFDKLSELEENIEPKDKAAAKQFCQTTRKPNWDSQ